jgi:hypothetical protein
LSLLGFSPPQLWLTANPAVHSDADAYVMIRARVKAIDEGRAVGIPYEQIKKEMAERFAPKDCRVIRGGSRAS